MCFVPPLPPHLPPEIAHQIVRHVADLLPIVHNIGHNMLSADRELVHWVLDSPMTDNAKAFIILLSIQLAQMADHFGSHMMEWYFLTMKFLLET